MDIAEFWHLIEQSERETKGKDARLDWLRDQLVQRSAAEIIDFDSWLRGSRRQVDTWLMWGAMRALFGFGSDDGFWYFHMWLVGLGREVFERVARDPDSLAEVPTVQRLLLKRLDGARWTDEDYPEFEGLADVARRAWEQATDNDDEVFFEALRSRGHELYALPHPGDEEWELDDPEERARRLPRIQRYKKELRSDRSTRDV